MSSDMADVGSVNNTIKNASSLGRRPSLPTFARPHSLCRMQRHGPLAMYIYREQLDVRAGSLQITASQEARAHFM